MLLCRLLCRAVMLGSSPLVDLLGMVAGHAYYFLEVSGAPQMWPAVEIFCVHRRRPAGGWPDLSFSVMPPCCAFVFSHRPPSVRGPPCCHWCPTSQDVYPRMTGRRPLKTPAIIRALFPAENIQAPRVAPMAAAAAPLGGGAAAGAAAAGGGFGGGAAAEGPAPAAAAAADGGGDGHHHAE